jgi:hypothetical protein
MNNKLRYTIGGVVAVVLVGILGTVAFTDIQSDPLSQTQSVGIGAYVTVEAYHEDGTMFQKWEGHNALQPFARNAIASCITGLDETPSAGAFGCRMDITDIGLHVASQIDNALDIQTYSKNAVVTLTPTACDPDSNSINSICTGWTMKSTFDFNQLSCTPNVDCINVKTAVSKASNNFEFNRIELNPEVPIIPNDRLVITMDFEIPI